MDAHIKGYIYVILSLLITGIAFIAVTIALRSVSIQIAIFYMLGSGFIASTLILIAMKKTGEAKLLLVKYWKPIIIIAVLNVASAFLWFNSLSLVGPSVTAFLSRFGTIFTIILSVMFLKESFNKLELLGALVMIAGAFLLSYNGGDFIILGIVVGIILSFTFSVWQYVTKIYIKHISPVVMNQVRLMLAFTIVGVYTFATGSFSVIPINVLGLLALASLCGGVIGFILVYKAMEITDLSKISTIQSLEPFIIVVYSGLILGSIPTGYQLVGGIVIVAGAMLMVLARYKPKFIADLIE